MNKLIEIVRNLSYKLLDATEPTVSLSVDEQMAVILKLGIDPAQVVHDTVHLTETDDRYLLTYTRAVYIPRLIEDPESFDLDEYNSTLPNDAVPLEGDWLSEIIGKQNGNE